MVDVKWIKLSTDMFDNEKIDFIQSLPEGDTIILIWVRLLTMAGKCNDNGYIFLTENIPYTEDYLAYKFKKSINIIKLALQTFENLRMIEIDAKGILLTNWFKYQSLDGLVKLKEKEQARLRKRKQREKSKQIYLENNAEINDEKDMSRDGHGDVTRDPSIIEYIYIDKDIDREIDIDKEKDIDGEEKADNYPPVKNLSTVNYQQIVDNFNNICKALPKVKTIDDNRKKLLDTIIIKFPSIEFYIEVFTKAQKSEFLSGRNAKWQGCTLDWLITEVNMAKTLEGNYDNRKSSDKASHDFNDYEQRSYDFKDLEEKLLGWKNGDDTG